MLCNFAKVLPKRTKITKFTLQNAQIFKTALKNCQNFLRAAKTASESPAAPPVTSPRLCSIFLPNFLPKRQLSHHKPPQKTTSHYSPCHPSPLHAFARFFFQIFFPKDNYPTINRRKIVSHRSPPTPFLLSIKSRFSPRKTAFSTRQNAVAKTTSHYSPVTPPRLCSIFLPNFLPQNNCRDTNRRKNRIAPLAAYALSAFHQKLFSAL